jgi:hypothetical protein
MKKSVATLCKSKAMPEMAAAPRTFMSIVMSTSSLSTSSSMKQSLAMKPQAVAYAATTSMNFP